MQIHNEYLATCGIDYLHLCLQSTLNPTTERKENRSPKQDRSKMKKKSVRKFKLIYASKLINLCPSWCGFRQVLLYSEAGAHKVRKSLDLQYSCSFSRPLSNPNPMKCSFYFYQVEWYCLIVYVASSIISLSNQRPCSKDTGTRFISHTRTSIQPFS